LPGMTGAIAGIASRCRVEPLERALAKQWGALAARYDKLAIAYRAAVFLSACVTWTRI
jgi:transposase